MSYEELSFKGFMHEMKEVSSGPHGTSYVLIVVQRGSLI